MVKGKFLGKFSGEFVDGTNLFRLDSYIRYISPRTWSWVSAEGFIVRQKEFVAPQGSTVDGASIPRAFWSITGGPYTGKYRMSSAIHDVLCVDQTIPADIVHELWEEMMYSEGWRNPRRYMMARAVQIFGPTWSIK